MGVTRGEEIDTLWEFVVYAGRGKCTRSAGHGCFIPIVEVCHA